MSTRKTGGGNATLNGSPLSVKDMLKISCVLALSYTYIQRVLTSSSR